MTKPSARKMARILLLLCVATAIAAPAQTFTTLANFNNSDGAGPFYMSLVQGVDGNLYGTTYRGGTYGSGVFFKVTFAGTLTTLYNFSGIAANPIAGVILGDDGDFYGTTQYGGQGYGTVYKITPNGSLTVLYSFAPDPNGAYPFSPLMQAADGNFYGTTAYGGPYNVNCFFGCGTIFKLTKAGEFTTLYSFAEASDGIPTGGLAQGPDGLLYGTSSGGNCCGGAVFKTTTQGRLTYVHLFCQQLPCTDGDTPVAGLILGNDGRFYGTTEYGGSNIYNEPWGTVFSFAPAPRIAARTIYNFCSESGCADGGAPFAGLFQGTDGNFYGTGVLDSLGGPEYGLVFNVTPSGTETPLHDFCSEQGCADGAVPFGAPLQATNGIFYGTTSQYGSFGDGTVYSLSMGLGPFVSFVRRVGRVGQPIGILGQGFTGTTSVSLNGIPASFTVKSDTFLEATVPAGATTGYVTVTTPSGTLTSNVPFHVIP